MRFHLIVALLLSVVLIQCCTGTMIMLWSIFKTGNPWNGLVGMILLGIG